MNRDDYTAEALRQLNNTDHYTECDTDPTHFFAKEISDTLVKIHNCNGINKDTFNYLIPQDTRTARFYLYCPKYTTQATWAVPFVSGNGSPTERISEFVDSYLNPLVTHTPSYIQDTSDFLRKLEGIKHQIPNPCHSGCFLLVYKHPPWRKHECMCHRSQIQ